MAKSCTGITDNKLVKNIIIIVLLFQLSNLTQIIVLFETNMTITVYYLTLFMLKNKIKVQ